MLTLPTLSDRFLLYQSSMLTLPTLSDRFLLYQLIGRKLMDLYTFA